VEVARARETGEAAAGGVVLRAGEAFEQDPGVEEFEGAFVDVREVQSLGDTVGLKAPAVEDRGDEGEDSCRDDEGPAGLADDAEGCVGGMVPGGEIAGRLGLGVCSQADDVSLAVGLWALRGGRSEGELTRFCNIFWIRRHND
jgi:hypothetical protein